ncbi:hypothetical protein KUV50_02435 [Membranicola marinus]|uniref:Peptidyl-prolyl cis-trans isomerase n=1 Tax=Membranihabitans marinus TaxID=1227546 RepID=A0A953HRI4_9BACT|nr:hypothetical protein [Membranihabitans marinus]MBY5956976.1 hypothetical protein [Membranihabitans marinus]
MSRCFGLLLNPNFSLIWLLSLLWIAVGCQKTAKQDESNELLVAEVGENALSLRELKNMYPDKLNSSDSVLISNALTDRWIKKEVFLAEAERSMGDINQLNELVNDYRESLILHKYEEQLLTNFSDTVVTNEDIETFFNQNPDQFKLKKTIVKFNLAVFPRESLEGEYDKVKKLWDEMNDQESLKIELVRYLDLFAEAFVLDTVWHELDELQSLLPEVLPKNILNKSHRLELEDAEHFYFLRIIDIAEETDDAPFTYIRNFAQKAILQKRRMRWLERVKTDLYQEALRDNKIKKYEN